MLYPSLVSRVSILVTKRTAIAISWGFRANAFLPDCVVCELTGRDCFLALGATLEVLVLSTFS